MGVVNKKFILSLVLGLFCIIQAHAQDFPKRTANGKEYYVYSVEPGNTLYAISKRFSVSVSDLMLANPGLVQSGLSIGSEVLVPIDSINKKEAKSKEIALDGEYILHTVQKKETLFSISKKYNIDINAITEINPKAQELKTGDVLKISTAAINTGGETYLEPARNDTFIVHQIVQGETLYSLAAQFDLAQDSIRDFNQLEGNALSVGQYVVIPKYNEAYMSNAQAVQDSIAGLSQYGYERKRTYNIGLMLPFDLQLNDSIEKAITQGKDLYVLTEISLEYYRGTKLALDSLRKMGFNANVHVYQVGEDVVAANDAVKKMLYDSLDMVFGPMHKNSLAIISDACMKNKIYLISPNSFSNEVFKDNPYLMRAEASRETMMRYLANYVAIQHQNDNVLMVNSESPKDWPNRKKFMQSYNNAAGTFPNHFSDSLRSITRENLEPSSVAKWLSKDSLNVLVVPSNELAFVSDFMTRLSRVNGDDYDIQVYGMDKWVNYENIDAQYKNRFNLRLVVPSFIIYDSEPVIHFLEIYRKYYNTDPSTYGFGYLGFDLTMFFCGALHNFGMGFPTFFDEYETHGVGVNYRFGRTSSGKEFENKDVYIIEYDEYKIKRVN